METEQERQIRRKKRIEEMKREKRRIEWLRKWGVVAGVSAMMLAGGIFWIAKGVFPGESREKQAEENSGTEIVTLQDVSIKEDDGQENSDPKGEGSASVEGILKGKGQNLAARADSTQDDGETVAADGLAANSLEEVISPEEAIPLSGPVGEVLEAYNSEDTMDFDESIISQYGVLIDVENSAILAEKEAHERMNPASMTKILTVLVAAEHLTEEDLEETVPITIDITDYCFVNECSITGYDLDEEVPVRDLFYGTILPSGADSAVALAIYVAGSHEAFVDMMNAKLEEMGIGGTTHFTNCVGLYDENHYSTVYDMAVILKAAVDNEFCREVLSAHTYKTVATQNHPDGLLISNWFLRRIEDRDTHGEVLCGKTGFVDQSGSCAASLNKGNDGKEYLCVTAGSNSSWRCIADQVELYQKFIPE